MGARSAIKGHRFANHNLVAYAVVVIGLVLPLSHVKCQSTSPNMMESPFASLYKLPHEACVTLYHRNGRIGCGTYGHETQLGRLVRFDNNNGISSNVLALDDDMAEQLVVVMQDDEFTTNNVALIQQAIQTANNNSNGAAKVSLSGILITNYTSTGSEYSASASSPASTTPNGYNTPSANLNPRGNYEWNTQGTNLEFQNFHGIPIGYIADSDAAAYITETATYQSSVSEHQMDVQGSIIAEFNYYMGGAGVQGDALTSVECLQWVNVEDGVWNPKCAPLGGQSIWASAGPLKATQQDYYNNTNQSSDEPKPVLLIGATMDGSSMFHEMSPSANSAASNIFVLLLTAKLVGLYADQDVLNNKLNKQIVFGFFEGDSYGFMGSRRFLLDVINGVDCKTKVTYSSQDKAAKTFEPHSDSCLYPMRTSLAFQQLGQIYGMISADQLGVLASSNTLYVHGANSNDNDNFIANVMLQCSTDNYSTAQTSTAASDEGIQPLPPTPLTSLLSISAGQIGGAVLTGFDDAFVADGTYRSHRDSVSERQRVGSYEISLEALVNAATILARTAIAVAYDDGSQDAESAVEFANGLIAQLEEQDSTAQSLYDCLFVDGNCEFMSSYAKVEYANEVKRYGKDFLGPSSMMGSPPNYYVSIFHPYYGQPFVQVGSSWYGAYDPTQTPPEGSSASYPEYGKSKYDSILIKPTGLEQSIHGMLNDFLGRPSGQELKTCSTSQDCHSDNVNYCSADYLEYATCSGGHVCVCSRAHYHTALDEALEAPPNEATAKFNLTLDDEGLSALYTEPYWSSSVGIKVYRKAGENVSSYVIGFGVATALLSFVASFLLERKLRKEKLH